jgi:hypothetical protein
VRDSDTNQAGKINVCQPDESMDEIPHEVVQEGSVVPVDPPQTIADIVLEQSSDSPPFSHGLNQVRH